MKHYEFEDAVVAPIQDIINFAEQHKENISGQALSSISLGFIVHDVWGGAVRKARRGPRNHRQHVYLNLKRSETTSAVSHENLDVVCRPLSDELACIAVPDEWKIIYDKPNCTCFVRPEKWEFNNARATTEMVVTKSAGSSASIFIKVKAHGCEKDLTDNICLAPLSSNKRVILALDFIEKSSFCTGISLPQGESIQASLPHVTGPFKYLVNDKSQECVKAFSSQCKIFSLPGSRCSECNNLLKVNNLKKQRKEKRAAIHPKCNKRYLTKEEENARINVEKREKYWKQKFEEESVKLEDDDHGDLSAMLNGIPQNKVPEEMTCLFEQQKKISGD